MDLSYILNQLGEDRAQYFGAVAPPIVQSSIFAFPTVDAMRAGFRDELGNHVYTRGNNPTVEILRKKVAALEGAEDCLMFGSGAAAMSAAVIACVSGGDHVVCVARPYSWTHAVLKDLLGRFSVETTFVDGTDVANFESAIIERTRELGMLMAIGMRPVEVVGLIVAEAVSLAIASLVFGAALGAPFLWYLQVHGIDLGGHRGAVSLAGIVVGGTSILGGEGAVWRTVVGVLFIALVGNGFNLLGVDALFQQITLGVILLVAVGIDAWSRVLRR